MVSLEERGLWQQLSEWQSARIEATVEEALDDQGETSAVFSRSRNVVNSTLEEAVGTDTQYSKNNGKDVKKRPKGNKGKIIAALVALHSTQYDECLTDGRDAMRTATAELKLFENTYNTEFMGNALSINVLAQAHLAGGDVEKAEFSCVEPSSLELDSLEMMGWVSALA